MLGGGAAADKADARGLTPLMWAASSGRVDAMKLLLKAGANANAVSAAGFTPLFFAIKSGVPQATEVMLAAGADTAHRGSANTSAAQLAAYQHNDAAVAMLLSHGADLAERDREGLQLLHRAAADGDAALVTQLIAKGADPNALTGPSTIKWVTEANFGMPPAPVPSMSALLIAAIHGQAATMTQLVAGGANPHFVAADGTNVVLAAITGSRAEALEVALAMAPDANVANAQGMTPLHLLVLTGGKAHAGPEFAAMLELLARHGARADIANKKGYTAASMAVGGLTEVRSAFAAVFPTDAAKAIAAAAAKDDAEKPDKKVRI
jgi:ankyrin repeat protein